MTTNHRTLHFSSGQAVDVGLHGAAALYLTEGEVLLRTSPQWLGDMVFQAPPLRLAAPAALPRAGVQSITAIGAVRLHREESAGALDRLASAWRRLRSEGFRAGGLARQ